MRKRQFALVLAGSVLLFCGLNAFAANSYYIDYAAGSDSNNGTSTTAPWQHSPGMQGCTATCARTTPKAGDKIILKGGVTWPNAAFPIAWTWSGTSGAPIYIGVDQTWYTGSSWTRPIFDAQNKPIVGGYNLFIRALSQSWVTWDNLEMRNQNWSGSAGYATLGCGVFAGGQGITLDHWYVHHWTHTGSAGDQFICITGDTNSPYMGNSVLQNSLFDNSDGDGNSGAVAYGWPGALRNVIHDVANGLLPTGQGEVAYNHIYDVHQSFDPSVHENAIETLIANGTYYIHDNLIHDTYGECFMIGNTNETDYVWNNVLYQGSTGNCNMVHFPQNNDPGVAMYIWGNTIVPRPGESCLYTGTFSSGWSTIAIQNNHCITTGTLYIPTPSAKTLTVDHNQVMTPTQAAVAGYSFAEKFAFSPTTSNCSGQPNCPVGAGTNLTSSWPAGYSTNDTSYACAQATGNVVSCPVRTSSARGTTWDAGTYQWAGDVNPPTGLTAVVR